MGRTERALTCAYEKMAGVAGSLSLLLETRRDLRRRDLLTMSRRLREAADELERLAQ